MFNMILQYFAFIASLFLILFLPGYLIIRLLLAYKKINLNSIEAFVFSVGISIFINDITLLFFGALGLKINRLNIIFALFAISAFIFFLINKKSRKKNNLPLLEKKWFSKKQLFLIIIILFLTFFIRTIYLQNSIINSATDLGHHMYWSNFIVENGTIPNYTQQNILTSTSPYSISSPVNISDFIIGEHLIFASLSLLSGLSVISYFPIITLFFLNIVTLFAILILAYRFFEKKEWASNLSIVTLLLLGPIFAISPPQTKFVSGGVIGNIIGNLFLPLALYCFLRALNEKNKFMLMLAFIFSMALFYTHHLTALIFLLTIILFFFLAIFYNPKELLPQIKSWLKLFFSWPVVLFLLTAIVFAILVYTPTYITNKAVSTVVGGPKKIEHTGLSLFQFKEIVGNSRYALAIASFFIGIFIFISKKKYLSIFIKKTLPIQKEINLGYLMLTAWILVIAIMSLYPSIIKISIPSGRVANYGSYPLSILAAFTFTIIFLKKNSTDNSSINLIKSKFLFSSFVLLFSYLMLSGYYDNSQNLLSTTTPQKMNQTFNAASYLSNKSSANDLILSDHVSIAGDSWIKIFFMRDYNFPFYRANLDRYENGIDRNEKCTLNMISIPSSPDSKKCFFDIGINYVMVNKKTDAAQFQKDSNFSQIYSNDEINIYYQNIK